MSKGSYEAWLELALIKEVSLEAKLAWLRAFGSPAAVLAQPVAELRKHSDEAGPLRGRVAPGDIEAVAAWATQTGGSCVFLGEPGYPRRVIERFGNAPLALFARGDLGLLEERAVAFTGSSAPTADAALLARTMALEAGREGLAVAAGVSPGVAQAALQGALTAPGPCLGVVGGAAVWESVRLGDEILAGGGLLLGEVAPRAPAPRQGYARRHRLLAALADLLLVVEAPLGCDTLKLAADAADVGCEVAAVPHSPSNRAGRGGNQLLRDGASLIENVKDLQALLP